MHLRCIPPV